MKGKLSKIRKLKESKINEIFYNNFCYMVREMRLKKKKESEALIFIIFIKICNAKINKYGGTVTSTITINKFTAEKKHQALMNHSFHLKFGVKMGTFLYNLFCNLRKFYLDRSF